MMNQVRLARTIGWMRRAVEEVPVGEAKTIETRLRESKPRAKLPESVFARVMSWRESLMQYMFLCDQWDSNVNCLSVTVNLVYCFSGQ
jgi:hypothetical protein